MMNGAEDAENAGDDDDDRYDAFYVFPFISMMSILPATWQTLSGKPSAGSSDFNWLQVVIENQIVGNLTFDTQSFETITQKNPTNPAHISYIIHTHTHVYLYIHILTCILTMAGTGLFFTFKLHMVIVIWMCVDTCEAYLGNRSPYHVNVLCV